MARKKVTKTMKAKKAKARDRDIDSSDELMARPNRKMPWFGWLGLAIMVVSEIALWAGFHPAAIAFTPIMWTGYILLVDGWIWQRGDVGRSYFRDAPRHWPMLALFSILIWVLFEMFNLKVNAWKYVNNPENLVIRELVYAWAFATIIPAMLRTRTLFATFKFFDRSHPWKNFKFTPFWRAVSFVVGLAFTVLPLMVHGLVNRNLLVPLVWLGLIFLIEPINYRIKAPSVFRDLEEGRIGFFWQALAAGLFCGLLWETWNAQASHFNGLVWDYILNEIYIKAGFGLYIGHMPILGFLGYPPFIWECFALWELINWAMHGDSLWETAGRRPEANLEASLT